MVDTLKWTPGGFDPSHKWLLEELRCESNAVYHWLHDVMSESCGRCVNLQSRDRVLHCSAYGRRPMCSRSAAAKRANTRSRWPAFSPMASSAKYWPDRSWRMVATAFSPPRPRSMHHWSRRPRWRGKLLSCRNRWLLRSAKRIASSLSSAKPVFRSPWPGRCVLIRRI